MSQRGQLLDDRRPVAQSAALHHLDVQPLWRQRGVQQARADGLVQVLVGQGGQRQVHRHVPGGAVGQGLPAGRLAARGPQHPQVERDDGALLLGQGDEPGGREQSQSGVLPSHQRLRADDVPRAVLRAVRRAEPQDRLQHQAQLLTVDPGA